MKQKLSLIAHVPVEMLIIALFYTATMVQITLIIMKVQSQIDIQWLFVFTPMLYYIFLASYFVFQKVRFVSDFYKACDPDYDSLTHSVLTEMSQDDHIENTTKQIKAIRDIEQVVQKHSPIIDEYPTLHSEYEGSMACPELEC